MKGKRGFQIGNKEGAKSKKGKHKKTIEKEMALQVMKEKILEKWGPLIEKKIELAEGIFVMKPVKVGGEIVDVKVYKEKPDSQSLEYLFSMVVGKPKEEIGINIKPIPILPYGLYRNNGDKKDSETHKEDTGDSWRNSRKQNGIHNSVPDSVSSGR